MAKFQYGEQPLSTGEHIISAKFATAKVDADVGKPVKLTGDSTWDLCADGDQIEGFLRSVEPFTMDGLSFGGVQKGGFKEVVCAGAIAIGDYVVASTGGKVEKAPAVTAGDATTVRRYEWRVVSGEVGVDAGDHTVIILRV